MPKYRRAVLSALSGEQQFLVDFRSIFPMATSNPHNRYSRQGFGGLTL
jgi:hypothetical protein